MNILLIWPPDIYGKYGRLGTPWLPIGLGTIASYLREKKPNLNIRILCVTLEKLDFDHVVSVVRSEPWDVIGLSYITVQAPYAFTLSKIIKKHSKALLIHGGVHPTTRCEEAVDFCDLCVLHEGEETFLEIINSLEKNNLKLERIKGIAYKKDQKVIRNPQRELIKNLDKIPFPAYDLMPMGKYEGRMHVTNEPSIDIMESRGCPYNCSFCVSPNLWQRKVRWHSPLYLINYMKFIGEKYEINNFHFHGDNFLLLPDWVEELCLLIKKEKLKVKWCALTRAQHVNKYKNLLPMMKEAGCIGIEIGIDSAETKALMAINKNQETSEVIEAFKNQQAAGMTPLFTLMGFNPMESIYGYYQQQRTVFKEVLGYNFIHPGQTSTPYPGTAYWEEKEKFGMVLAKNWEEFDHKLIPFLPFSLLQGKPKKVLKTLRLNDFFIILGTYFTYRVDLFPKKIFTLENLSKALGYWKKLSKYYSLCNGDYTVEEIGRYLSQQEIMREEESLRFTGFTTLMCAKMGIIKDMASAEMKNLEVKPLFSNLQEQIKSIWQYFSLGASFHFLGKKEKTKATWQ
ncbi:MAG: B12-binding domain-containing radical SAM protein [Patescibacteria group bacterium]|nr:B12-binding domain-containing radical SAM protein [Patescibacteria group bacterium]